MTTSVLPVFKFRDLAKRSPQQQRDYCILLSDGSDLIHLGHVFYE